MVLRSDDDVFCALSPVREATQSYWASEIDNGTSTPSRSTTTSRLSAFTRITQRADSLLLTVELDVVDASQHVACHDTL